MLNPQSVWLVPEAAGLSTSRLVRGTVEHSKQRLVSRDLIKAAIRVRPPLSENGNLRSWTVHPVGEQDCE
jgi:hypothetical protein